MRTVISFFLWLLPIAALILIIYFFFQSGEKLILTSLVSILAFMGSLFSILLGFQRETIGKEEKYKAIVDIDFRRYVESEIYFTNNNGKPYEVVNSKIEANIFNLGYHAKKISINSLDDNEKIICGVSRKYLKQNDSVYIEIINDKYDPKPRYIEISYEDLNNRKYRKTSKINLKMIDQEITSSKIINYYSIKEDDI
ncbi:hypothetical protein [Marinomonas sp. TW1]|uniref:hypothetical protein n=1 Tax=Marinomonas sp. TW1 TaxID=1561203 RepID=UPI0007AF769D|nr:hypothetical protein [Marinomonas sp. TW1]KZN15188.1 hypothetical protein OA79_03065 [Marinomonas sp. TW1]